MTMVTDCRSLSQGLLSIWSPVNDGGVKNPFCIQDVVKDLGKKRIPCLYGNILIQVNTGDKIFSHLSYSLPLYARNTRKHCVTRFFYLYKLGLALCTRPRSFESVWSFSLMWRVCCCCKYSDKNPNSIYSAK